ncbi:DUF389 domain-containing protein [Flavobacterium piscinae]|uniref:DUF389 domain-containing protein n=1 Tax=Flavobacterium piscinae TaxID=2506424 RepID=A0A4Q1KWS1_9FLAO|nr:DUF389 domain-containing protein [Flavobacterium piscinae]MBC8884145.1 DUF389 domain-containing protein [Flavobacterium piscinae]RXR34758.1 DUF389 domain-containing protein [Flavobacterium piscinae]
MENTSPNTPVKSLWLSIKLLLKSTLDIREDTNHDTTIEEVKAGISIKGQGAWVLIFSILIASAGLNTSSTAVVIGAMLISPLMGPIVGIGLSLGINDVDLMRKAIKNFGIMVVLALFTSFLFFSIPIFQKETPELIARTYPDVRDVIIAFAGGFALIVALSRKNKQVNTIAGVAIATALMPPLCTAGFGLATRKWEFFGGAMFLFTINTIFIALATFIIVKSLKFPMQEYLNSSKSKRISRILYLVAFLILTPSIYMFYGLYKKTDFEQKVNTIITTFSLDKDVVILNQKVNFQNKTVSFATVGKSVTNQDVEEWSEKLKKQGYSGVKFEITQSVENLETQNMLEKLESTYYTTQQILNKKEELLVKQEKEIIDLQKQLYLSEKSKIPFDQIANEIKINYNEVAEVAYSRLLKTNFTKIDTVPIIYIKWNNNLNQNQILSQEQKIQKWLRLKLQNEKLTIQKLN